MGGIAPKLKSSLKSSSESVGHIELVSHAYPAYSCCSCSSIWRSSSAWVVAGCCCCGCSDTSDVVRRAKGCRRSPDCGEKGSGVGEEGPDETEDDGETILSGGRSMESFGISSGCNGSLTFDMLNMLRRNSEDCKTPIRTCVRLR